MTTRAKQLFWTLMCCYQIASETHLMETIWQKSWRMPELTLAFISGRWSIWRRCFYTHWQIVSWASGGTMSITSTWLTWSLISSFHWHTQLMYTQYTMWYVILWSILLHNGTMEHGTINHMVGSVTGALRSDVTLLQSWKDLHHTGVLAITPLGVPWLLPFCRFAYWSLFPFTQ